MRKWLGSVVVALTLVLAGCSGQQDQQIPVNPAGAGSSVQNAAEPPPENDTAALPASTPTEISIPKLGAKSTLIPLGLNADQTIEVPPVSKPLQAGWYTKAPTPGEIGPAVILGHVDGNKQPGIFYRLKELAAGDEVLVSREDGKTAKFVVTKVDHVAKKEFPTDVVYGNTDDAQLRLITCGGEFDHAAHSYVDNIVVFAKLVL